MRTWQTDPINPSTSTIGRPTGLIQPLTKIGQLNDPVRHSTKPTE
jgi:hypothetical protein